MRLFRLWLLTAYLVTVALGALFPDKLTLALEIRPKVTEFVRLRIEALRAEQPGQVREVSNLMLGTGLRAYGY